MAKVVYCSTCGTPLTITRKAMPKFGRIIDVVPAHMCAENALTLEELDILPNPIPTEHIPSESEKFVQNLHKLQPDPTTDFRSADRRPKDQVKQTTMAPKSLIDSIRNQGGEGEE